MAREVVLWCDQHLHRDGSRETGQTHNVELDGKAFEIDVCEVCWKDATAALYTLAEHAQPVIDDRPRAVCPVEGCERTYLTRASLRDHVRDHHEQDVNELEAQRGLSIFGEPLTHSCDEPDCGRQFSSGHALGAHRRFAHSKAGKTTAKKSPKKKATS